MRWFVLIVLSTCALAQDRQITVEKYEAPKYPVIARAARISGDVILILTLNRDGSVASARSEKGHVMLKEASIASIKQWRFHCWNCEFGAGFEHKIIVSFAIAGCLDDSFRSYRFQFPDSMQVTVCGMKFETTVSY
jgi:TonB family protein